MLIADLYIRVSTDEQVDKGYSQRDQHERLERYCNQNQITIGQVIFEDHSAKNFNRLEWTKYINHIKKRSLKSNLVLFTKWDRFSRNAGDAYQMIKLLLGNNISPQAIEQPLDMSIPENKMMLAIYLAAPEVENDRRALNTFYGMRRAQKEGRKEGLWEQHLMVMLISAAKMAENMLVLKSLKHRICSGHLMRSLKVNIPSIK